MTDLTNRYTYRVIWSEDDQEHVGLCTEFPSLSWLEATPEQKTWGQKHGVKTWGQVLNRELSE